MAKKDKLPSGFSPTIGITIISSEDAKRVDYESNKIKVANF